MTKPEAIEKVMENNNGLVTWEILYNEIGNYYPNITKPKDWKAALRGTLYREVGKRFKKIDESTYSLMDYDTDLLLHPNISKTTREVIATIRIGQQQLREKLLRTLRYCPITGIDVPELLISSHIKPWAMSDNKERLDVFNGFLFSPTFDEMFDRGLISFSDNKNLIISSEINKRNRDRLSIQDGMKIHKLPIHKREKYLEFHREKILRR
ncbi:MAG: HNH endonuclease [Candidatus Dadabacteria bacterium]|nr:HNH endonuclease [Candidatus Dadabacteria bacterium]